MTSALQLRFPEVLPWARLARARLRALLSKVRRLQPVQIRPVLEQLQEQRSAQRGFPRFRSTMRDTWERQTAQVSVTDFDWRVEDLRLSAAPVLFLKAGVMLGVRVPECARVVRMMHEPKRSRLPSHPKEAPPTGLHTDREIHARVAPPHRRSCCVCNRES